MSEIVQLQDLEFEPFISKAEILKSVQKLAEQINADYAGEELVLICVLKGSFVFVNDLLRFLTIPTTIDFIKVSSYQGLHSTGKMKIALDFDPNIKDKHILLVEDIIDSGKTSKFLLDRSMSFSPRSTKLVTLLFKPNAIKVDLQIDYVGMEIPNDFVVGYGMDYNEQGRGLPEIYKLKK